MHQHFHATYRFLKQVVQRFLGNDCPQMAAALAYYTIFSLPALLVILVTIAGSFLDSTRAKGGLSQEISRFVGPSSGAQIQTMLEHAEGPGGGGALKTAVGIGVLIFGATGALAQLQVALNRIWRVEPDPRTGGLRTMLLKRILSFAMLLVVGFLLLVSLVLSTLLSAFGDWIANWLAPGVSGAVLQLGNQTISLLVVAFLFAALFKFLPDAMNRWRDVAIGASITAVLFVLGKYLIGLYLGGSDIGSAYGAAGSLAVVLIWIYFSATVLLAGAEFTWCWANRFGTESVPEEGAVHTVTHKEHVRDANDVERESSTASRD